jgi:anti-sigma B factor antagonist
MQLYAQAKDRCSILRVEERRIDAAAVLAFKTALRAAAEEAGEIVLLDLSVVDFIDSSGLGGLVSCLKALAPAQELRLAGLNDPVARVLRLTRLDEVFVTYPTVAAALDHIDG